MVVAGGVLEDVAGAFVKLVNRDGAGVRRQPRGRHEIVGVADGFRDADAVDDADQLSAKPQSRAFLRLEFRVERARALQFAVNVEARPFPVDDAGDMNAPSEVRGDGFPGEKGRELAL